MLRSVPKRQALVLALVLLLSGFSYAADIYIKQRVQNKAYVLLGKEFEAKEEIFETWIAKNKLICRGEQISLLMLLDKNVLYYIDHDLKLYVPMDLPVDISLYFPDALLQVISSTSLQVSSTGNSLEIDKKKCQIYEITIDSLQTTIRTKIWATTDVPFDWKTYSEKIYPELAKVIFKLPESSLSEIRKISGFAYQSETKMNFMGTEMHSERKVMEMERRNAPEGTYSLPQGYIKKEKLNLEDIRF